MRPQDETRGPNTLITHTSKRVIPTLGNVPDVELALRSKSSMNGLGNCWARSFLAFGTDLVAA